ncbi:MAG: ANTAR domain-containing protein [Rubrivivax sp.]|nr:ANTAR domain-containing protein [Rubrivivax sp.]
MQRKPPSAPSPPDRRSAAPSGPEVDALPAAAPPPPSALRVLLVDDGAHRVDLIRDELTAAGHTVVGVVDAAVAIHDCVQRLQPDVVIVDAESPSRDTLENLATVSARNPRPVVVFSEDDSEAPMQQALKAGVSAYVIAGLQPHRLAPVLKVAIARFEQDRALRAQLEDAELKLSERKQIERAKGLLMDEIGLSEEQAYAHLRKLAMDRGQRLAEVAQRVIDAQGLMRPRG